MWRHIRDKYGDQFKYLQMRDMIQSLRMTGDIEKIDGFTRNARYIITDTGKKKLGA